MLASSVDKTRKVNPDWLRWCKRRKAIRDERSRYENTWSEHGQKWLDAMVADCNRRLTNLNVNKPPKYLED